jgi:uncharacterized membrane protein
LLKRTLIALSTIGLLNAAYLTWVKLADRLAICAGVGDCETVNSSIYSEVGGIPIALFGVVGYLAITLILVFEERIEYLRENGPMLVFGLSMAGLLYSAYLTYLELFVIHAVCPYCVLSALVMLGLFGFSWQRLRLQWSEA